MLTILCLVALIYVVVIVNEIKVFKLLYILERNKLESEKYFDQVGNKIFTKYSINTENEALPKMLILGDCMAISTGATSKENRLNFLAEKEYSEKFKVNCYGHIGATVADLIKDKERWSMQAEIVWLFIGPNDIKRFKYLSFSENLDKLFFEIQNSTHAKQIVWSIGDFSSVPSVPIILKPFAIIIEYFFKRIAVQTAIKHNVKLLRIMTKQNEDPFYISPEIFYAPDMFHPSDLGYQYIFGEFTSLLSNMQKKLS